MANLRARLLIQTTFVALVLGGLLFLAAGTIAWPAAWRYLAEFWALSLIVGFRLAARDPRLLAERMRPVHRDQPRWDRVFLILAVAAFLVWMFALGLARRAGSGAPLAATEMIGAVLTAASMGLSAWTFETNSFAVPQVRVQADRAHAVVDRGPYAAVRHPMYAAALLFFLGAPIQLGSFWGLLAAPLFAIAFAWRLRGEEAALLAALPDYAAYRENVRFRLVPGLW